MLYFSVVFCLSFDSHSCFNKQADELFNFFASEQYDKVISGQIAGWAFADSVLHRLAPLWVGARELEFTWEYIFQGLEANASLVLCLLPNIVD